MMAALPSPAGAGFVAPQTNIIQTIFASTSGWTVLGNDTANLTTDVTHAIGTTSLEFDKVDGAANTVFAGVYRTVDLEWGDIQPTDRIVGAVQASALTNIAYAFIRLGTSVSHYSEFRLADSAMTAGVFSLFNAAVGSPSAQVGNGVSWGNIDYLAVGVAFDGEANTLADIYWNYIGVERPLLTRT